MILYSKDSLGCIDNNNIELINKCKYNSNLLIKRDNCDCEFAHICIFQC